MTSSPTPTRAGTPDVAAAVMMSAESASGEYPIDAVTVMGKIVSTVAARRRRSRRPARRSRRCWTRRHSTRR
ncbi:pyruvate kinase [Burkholderia cepacia]|uniref:pyruvate kinase n=1 Tax=Burkholderia cepacia TaxID=292 RepID=UPI0022AA1587|nr:pyruvate kinase [Burkholderia cepacia]